MESELRRPTASEFVCKANNVKCAFTALVGHLHLPAKPKLSLPYFKASGIHREFSKKQFKAEMWLRGKPQLAELSSVNTSCLPAPLQTKPKMLWLKRKTSVAMDPSPVQTHTHIHTTPPEMLQENHCISQPKTSSTFLLLYLPQLSNTLKRALNQKAAQSHTVRQACASSVYHKGQTSRR